MILAIIAISSLVQGALYFFAAKRKLAYLDFLVLGMFIVANIWLFPRLFVPRADPLHGGCAFSEEAMGQMAFMFVGTGVTVTLFIISAFLRRGEKA